MVALNSSVWRVSGSFEQMNSMSGMKPMSSMRSASSITSNSQPLSRILPACGCSSRLRQRRKVLLPEPLEPMMLITSPALADIDTPLITSWLP